MQAKEVQNPEIWSKGMSMTESQTPPLKANLFSVALSVYTSMFELP